MKNADLHITSPLPALKHTMTKLRRYVGFMIFLLFAAAYGYVIVQINSLSNPTVDQASVLAEVKSAPTPRIDDAAAQQLLKLKDNSVNVQSIFPEGRGNPFGE